MRRGLYITTLVFLLMSIAEVIGQTPSPNRLAKQLMAKKNQRSDATLPMYELLAKKDEGALHERAFDIAENTTITSMDVRAASRLMRAHPALIQFDFPIDGEMVSLELFSASPVSLDFLVRTSEGEVLEGEGIHYRGIVKDDHQSIASISIYDGEIIGLVSSEIMGNIVIGKWTDEVGSHVIYRDQDLKILQDFECNAMHIDGAQQTNRGSTERSAAKCVKVYFETSYGLYQNKGNNVNTVRNYVTGLFNGVSTLYANEGLGIEISEIFVWSTADPFNHSGSSAATASFMSQRPSFNGDIGHLLDYTGSSNGGLAYIDVLCSSTHNYAYSDIGLSYANFPTYSWTINVVAHEIGHNYGSPHTHACEWGPQGDQALDNCRQTEGGCDPGPEPTSGGTIMSYCHLGSGNPGINFNNGFGPEPGDLLRSHAASANCLTECGSGGGGSCNVAITNIIEQDASCGENNGKLTVQISGASGAVTYDIGHGAQSSNVFNGLAPGSYTVTVLNGGGCERQESATIGGGSTAPTLNAVVLNATCGQDDGQIELTTIGGSAPFSFRIGTKTQSSPIFTGLMAGDYTATVTDDGGCSSSKQLTVFTQDAASMGTEITHSSCGEENGVVLISALGGQAPFTYLLGSLQSANGSFTNLAPGSYVAQVVDQNGCSDDQNVTVNPSTAIEASLTVQSTTCGQADGMITVEASGGSGSLRYSMGGGFGTDPSFSSVAAGNYTIQVKDANQCILSLEAEVEASQAFALTTEISAPSCGLDNAAIALTVDGSVGPFTYKLNDIEQESPFFDQLSSGIHQLTAIDGDGCTQNRTIEVAGSLPLEITTDVENTRCAVDNGEVTIEVSNAIGNLTYLSGNQMQSEPQFDELAPGAYVFKVQDSLGCQDSVAVQIDSSIRLQVHPNVSPTECGEDNGSVVFTDVQGASPMVYSLASISGNGFTYEGADSIIDLLPPGLHKVFVSDADDCLYQDTIEIAPSSGIAVHKQVAHTTCNQTNGEITVEASGGTGMLTIQLDTMHNENRVFDFLAARSYVLAVQDEVNCVVTDTIEIQASTSPQLTTKVAHTTCGRNNGSLEFQISGGVGPYQYFVDSKPISESVEGLAAGSYPIMVMDSFECVDSTVLAVRPSSAPVVSYESESASCYQKNGIVRMTGSEGVLPYSYVLGSTSTEDNTFLALDSGSYLLQIIDSVGCRDSAQVIVSYDDQFKKPDLISSASICEGDPAVLDAGLEMINGAAQWTHDGAVFNDTSPIIMVSDAGTYVFSINYHENCQVSDTTLVTVRQKPIQTLSAMDTICRGSAFVLETIDDQLNYEWDNGSMGAVVAFDQSGRYTLTSTNIYGCSTTGEIDVEVIQPVVLSSPAKSYFICEGAEMELMVDGADTYIWTSNDPDFLPTQVPSPFVSPSKDADYQVIGLNTCFADTLDLFIGIRVQEDIVTRDTTVIEGSPIVLSVAGANSGMWSSPFDASCVECTETEIRPDQQGDVHVSYEDSHGCSWQDTIQIDVIPLQDVFPRLVNVITPNQDGRNDLLVFEGLDQFKSSTIQVFDQRGTSIYENDAYDNTWNGQYEGGLLPEGVYFYMLTLQLDDRVFHFDSDLTLVRD